MPSSFFKQSKKTTIFYKSAKNNTLPNFAQNGFLNVIDYRCFKISKSKILKTDYPFLGMNKHL